MVQSCLWHPWHKSVWSTSCHSAFRQVIPVFNGGWKEGCMSVCGATLNQCELSGMSSSLSGRGWCQLGAVDHDFAVEDLKKHGESGDISSVLWRGPLQFVNYFLYTRGVVVPVDDKSSCLSLNCLYPVYILFCVRIPHCAGIHIPARVRQRSCRLSLFNWVGLTLRLCHKKWWLLLALEQVLCMC